MSILTALQPAARRLLNKEVTDLFGSSDRAVRELIDLAQESAVAIAKSNDWQRLKVLHTVTGDAVTVLHSMPGDLLKMPTNSVIVMGSSGMPLMAAKDDNQWLAQEATSAIGPAMMYHLIGGKIGIRPVLSATETVKFYYITNKLWAGSKTAPTENDDAFALPERLITLATIWRYRAQKRLEYGEDMTNFEIAFAEETADDRGKRVIHVSDFRVPANISSAYPYTLG